MNQNHLQSKMNSKPNTQSNNNINSTQNTKASSSSNLNIRQFGTDITNCAFKQNQSGISTNNSDCFTQHSSNYYDSFYEQSNNLNSTLNEHQISFDIGFKESLISSSSQDFHVQNIVETLYSNQEDPTLHPFADYMTSVQDNTITEKMREILFNWLVSVHEAWRLKQETLYLTFNIIDRFLSNNKINKDFLQCIGVSSLLIACKYEEIYFPGIMDFVEVTAHSFQKSDILEMEYLILTSLNFHITISSPLKFYEYFISFLNIEGNKLFCVQYLLELAAFSYPMLKYRPSCIASAVMLIAVNSDKNKRELLLSKCKHSFNDLVVVVNELSSIYSSENNGSCALKNKFRKEAYNGIGMYDVFSVLLG